MVLQQLIDERSSLLLELSTKLIEMNKTMAKVVTNDKKH